MSDREEFERVDPKEECSAQCQARMSLRDLIQRKKVVRKCQNRTNLEELIQRKNVVRSVRPGRVCLAYEVSPPPP